MKTSLHLTLLTLFAVAATHTRAADPPTFTEEQAAAGQTAYVNHCADCHGEQLEGLDISPALTGDRFDQTWRGKSAAVLAFHVRRMPPESAAEPGAISDDAYIHILAYLLAANGFAPGDDPLPNELAALEELDLPRLPGAEYDPDAPVELTDEQRALLENLPAVTQDMRENPDPADWIQWGRTYDGLNESPLDEIDRETVADLVPAWRAPLRPGVNMATPLVLAGVMYLHTYPDTVLALDAATGDVLWRHQYEPATGGSSQKMGLGLHGHKLLVPTSDLHLLALDSRTGELLWDHTIDTPVKDRRRAGYNLRSAPFIVGDKLIQGVTASFVPQGGFILALDVNSGEELWRFNTIARPDEPFGHTWNGLPLEKRSGGSVWHQGTYDPELNLVYFGIAPTYDTGPLLKPADDPNVNCDALYTNCTVALNPDTGELVWHYQHMANDQWDLDWVFERQIVTINYEGEPRKVVMNVGKMAILEAVDAATGEYLFSVDPGVQDVIIAIDPETGEKTFDLSKMPDLEKETDISPSAYGARSWPATSYSPRTNLHYMPLTENTMRFGKTGIPLLSSGVRISNAPHPDTRDGMLGRLQAIDLTTRDLAWTTHLTAPLSTSVLATAGGILFCGDLDPALKAFDESTGELLWSAPLDASPTASLVTYSVDGRQFIAVAVGSRNFHIDGLDQGYALLRNAAEPPIPDPPKGGAAIWAFAIE